MQATPKITPLYLAEGVTRIGDAVTLVALPLTAVLVLNASSAGLALIGAAQALPILLLSMPIGLWVDRQAKRWPILVAADVVRALLLASVPAAAAFDLLSLPLLAAIAFCSSVAGSFFDLAFAGWVPRLLGGDALHRANARIELARSAAAVGGPALGGALVAAITAPFALLADAFSFLGSGVLILSVRQRERPGGSTERLPASLRELAAGLLFVWRQPLVRAVTATAGVNNLTRSIAMAVAILYLVEEGRLSPVEIGIAFALGNTGFAVGAVASRLLSQRLGMGRTMQVGVGLFGPSMLLLALTPAAWAGPAFAFALFANGFGIAIHNVNQVTVRQLLTPDSLRARTAAVFRLVIFGSLPLGTLLGGLIGEAFGLRAALLAGALGLFAGSVPYALVHVGQLRSVEQLVLGQTGDVH